MKQKHQLILGALSALAVGTGLPVTPTAGAQESPYVSKEDYLKLQREHEQLKREMQELRTLVQGAGQKPVPAAGAVEGKTATAEPTKADDALTLGRYVFPGSTKFLLTGYGSAGFNSLRHSDATFEAQFNPLFLWKLSDRLLFEGE